MTSYAFEPGDRVQWPMTSMPASEEQSNSLTVEDVQKTRYMKSGKFYCRYLYKELLQRMIDDMKDAVMQQFDNLVVIDGSEGVGKSNLAYKIATRFDPDFDIQKSLIYTLPQFLDAITGEDVQKVYWFDEAVIVAAGRKWQDKGNMILFELLQFIRSMGLTLIMCIPKFDNIDVYIRTFRTRYVVTARRMRWCEDREAVRGYAELYIPKSPEERDKLPEKAKAKDFFKSVGFFRFPVMPPEVKEIYEKIKAKNRQNRLIMMREQLNGETESALRKRDKRSLEALVSYMTDTQGMSYKEVADIAGMPYSTVKNMVWRTREDREE